MLFPRHLNPTSLAPFAVLAAGLPAAAERPPVDHPEFAQDQVEYFEKEVRPLLAEHCFRCHGGTDSKGKVRVRSSLQLISRRGVVLGGDHGPAIDEARPGDSLLLKMISYSDPDHSMPPKGKLAPGEIETLTRWVEMGAPWSADDIDHLVEVEEDTTTTTINETTKNFWSNRPMARPEVPEVGGPAWAGNPIDAFIYAKLAGNGLEPNPEAGKETLARRAFYNLTGLAPAPEEVAAFVADRSPDAWTALVEELLARPQYGEKWARHWLDVVRYAESNGFERDAQKPFIWRYRDWVIDAFNDDKPYDQFVMEQLAGDELDQVTRESMIATGYHRLMQWDDEPADPLQHKYDVYDDIVRTTTEGFLGMTMGCARCHDHKGEPLPQTDYYRFMAFFHGITDMGKGKATVRRVADATDPEEAKAELAAREEEVADLTSRIAKIEEMAVARFAKSDPELRRQLAGRGVKLADPVLVADHRTRAQRWHYTTEKPRDGWSAVGFRAENEKWKTGVAPFGTQVPGERAKTPWRTGDIWLQATFQLTQVPPSLKLKAYHDEDVEIFLNGQKVAARTGHSTRYVDIPLGKEAAAALQTGRNVVAVHVRQTSGGQFFDMNLSADEGARRGADVARLIRSRGKEVFTAEQLKAYNGFVNRLAKAKAKPGPGAVEAMVVFERGVKVPPLHVHVRGNASTNGERVEPGFPEIFGGGEAVVPTPKPGQKTSGRRRALAEWIVRPDNRRTARVMVNRIWQYHFGRGICATSSDFGYLGTMPTHPELLDWLATEFVRRGWSIKEMHRLIMSSKTYRMSSRARQAALAKDPQNDLFWRFNMRRFSAEEIRDSTLAVTGELNLKRGGPSMYPELDEAVLATSSTKGGKWGKSPPEEQNRRSVYITIKRSLVPPELTSFDFGDTDAPCPVRFATTVPTQALNMLNSRFLNTRAAKFAERLRREAGAGPADQVRRGFELVASRPARDAEVAVALEMLKELQADHGLTADQALERFCLVALNLNEFIFLD